MDFTVLGDCLRFSTSKKRVYSRVGRKPVKISSLKVSVIRYVIMYVCFGFLSLSLFVAKSVLLFRIEKLQRRTPRRKKRTEGSPSWIELQGVIFFIEFFFLKIMSTRICVSFLSSVIVAPAKHLSYSLFWK